MNVRRMVWIGVVWLGCAVAWMVLGTSLVVRSADVSSGPLLGAVHSSWGPPLDQRPPTAFYRQTESAKETTVTRDKLGGEVETTRMSDREVPVAVPLGGSDVSAGLELDYRRKGLVWFSTYRVAFEARYVFTNASDSPRRLEVSFPLPSENAIYDGFRVSGAAEAAIPFQLDHGKASWAVELAPRATHTVRVQYRTRGTSSWTYRPGDEGQVRNFRLWVHTNFSGVDFPAGTLSPSRGKAAGSSWEGAWEFTSLVSRAPIEIVLPAKINPGPLAARVTFFAPVGLLFFFFVLALLVEVRQLRLEPFHYLLIGCGFFAFHLLFAYLADHVSLAMALALSSGVSLLLVVSYARLLVGWQFALREMGLAQLLYLVGFSLTFLLDGYTGLAITIGAIATLFVMMQVTGRALGPARTWPAVLSPPERS